MCRPACRFRPKRRRRLVLPPPLPPGLAGPARHSNIARQKTGAAECESAPPCAGAADSSCTCRRTSASSAPVTGSSRRAASTVRCAQRIAAASSAVRLFRRRRAISRVRVRALTWVTGGDGARSKESGVEDKGRGVRKDLEQARLPGAWRWRGLRRSGFVGVDSS